MAKSIYKRALGISFLKSLSYIIAVSAGLIFVAERVSPILFIVVLHFFYFLITFLFAEWIFEDVTVRTKQLVIIIIYTFVVETVLSVSFFRFMGMTTFNFAVVYKSFIFLALHGGAMFAALYVRKRIWAKEGLAEGLES
jgi:hypothetical protein